MAVPDIDGGDGYDAQDSAETFDETHSTDELGYPDETRSFEPDLFDDEYDATSAAGDADEDDVALDADEFNPDDLNPDDIEDDEAAKLFMDDDLEDEDDGLDSDEAFIERDAFQAADDEAEMTLVASIDDATNSRDRLSRRYESSGELSDEDVRELGYAGRGDKESDMGENKENNANPKAGPSADDVVDESNARQEELLDEGVEETFPASDPVSVKHIT